MSEGSPFGKLGPVKGGALLVLMVTGLWVAGHLPHRPNRRVGTPAEDRDPPTRQEALAEELARAAMRAMEDAGDPGLPMAPPLPSLGASSSAAPAPPPASASPTVLRPLPSVTDSARELALVQQAQTALLGAPDAALGAAEEDVRRYPHGLLREQAEVIAIEALARTGRLPAAKARAAKFALAYPRSTHQRRIDAILGPPPDP